MTGKEIVDRLTDGEAYELLSKAQRYAATLPEPEWSQNEGHWARATASGTVNGQNPEGVMKRDEMIAVLGRMGKLD